MINDNKKIVLNKHLEVIYSLWSHTGSKAPLWILPLAVFSNESKEVLVTLKQWHMLYFTALSPSLVSQIYQDKM